MVQNGYLLEIWCTPVCLVTFESYETEEAYKTPTDGGTEAALQTHSFWYPNDSSVDQNEGRHISYD